IRIKSGSMVEHETLAVIVGATALFEVFEDAAVELEDIPEAFAFHEWPGLLATNAAGAEHDDRALLEFGRQLADGLGKLPEMVDADGQCIPERSQLYFIVVASVQQR